MVDKHMDSVPGRTITVAVPTELVDQLVGLSIVDETTLAEQVIAGLAYGVKARKADPEFPTQLAAYKENRLKELGYKEE